MKSKTIAAIGFNLCIVMMGAAQLESLTNMARLDFLCATNPIPLRPLYFFENPPYQHKSNYFYGCWWTWQESPTNDLRVTFQWLVETNTPRDLIGVSLFYATNSAFSATNWWLGGNPPPPEPKTGEDGFTVYSNLLMRVEYKGKAEEMWLESIPFLTYKRKWSMQKVYEQ